MSEDIKVVEEVAEEEFKSWAESMDLDIDESKMDEDDKGSFRKQKSRIIRAITKGSLTFNDDDEAVYTPCNKKSLHKEPITFHERSGASLMSMDGKKKGHDVQRTYAVLGEMCKVHPKVFAGLVGVDIKVCEAIFAFLMD